VVTLRPLLPADRAEVVFDGFRTTPRLDHPEGIDIDPADGTIWCGGEAGQLYRIDVGAQSIELVDHNEGGFTLGVRLGPDGNVYWLDALRRQVRRMPTAGGTVEVVVDGRIGEVDLVYPNALDITADGTVYFTDSRAHADGGDGLGVFVIRPDGSSGLWSAGPFDFANGIVVDETTRAVYVAESAGRSVYRIPMLDDGSAGTPERVCDTGDRVPDGLAIGPDGLLYITCYYPSQILRVEADGAMSLVFEDVLGHVLSNPTNLTFHDGSAWIANLGRWHITRLDVSELFPPERIVG
jgi:gluconolactonase